MGRGGAGQRVKEPERQGREGREGVDVGYRHGFHILEVSQMLRCLSVVSCQLSVVSVDVGDVLGKSIRTHKLSTDKQ